VRIPSRQGELAERSSSGDEPGGRGPSGTPHGSAPGRAERPPPPRGTPGGEPGAEISLGGLLHGSRDEETGRPRGRCPAADRTQAQEVDPRPRGRQVRLRGGGRRGERPLRQGSSASLHPRIRARPDAGSRATRLGDMLPLFNGSVCRREGLAKSMGRSSEGWSPRAPAPFGGRDKVLVPVECPGGRSGYAA